ncbi:MAG: terminase large subunit [Clostridiales bacterium]|nr:terminase large subunit [Clostridiales bacterium]
MDNYIYAYYQKINDGSIVVGQWIHKLYEIIVNGIEDGTYIFNQQKADRAIRFIETFCRHNKGKLAPRQLKLSLWEKAFISCVYGIVDENNRRVFREVALFVGRKCGKTLLASAIMAYEVYVDGEFGSEIYCVAPKLDQADLVFSAFEFTKDKNPDLAKRTRKRKNDYIIDATNTTIKKIAFNEKKADGYNPQLNVLDEMSSWPAERGLRQYEVMVSGTGARQEPLTLSISSGGYVNGGVYDELVKRGTRFLLGESNDKRLLPIFYMIDDIEKWDDINELRKSLPGMGESVPVQFILDEIDVARDSLSKKTEFICKYANLKQNSTLAWLPSSVVERMCGEQLKLEDFRSSYCVAGIDLSQTTDLTAATIVVEKDGELYVFAKFWLPAEKIDEAIERDGVPYNIYLQRGLLALSGDNFVDYHDCYDWLVEMVEKYEILPLMTGYDRYSAQYLIQDLNTYGFRTSDVYQGDNLWPVLQEMEGLFKDGKVHIGDNDLLKIHLLNAAIKINAERGRGKLVKLNPVLHIDGVAALADAFCVRQHDYAELGDRLRNE